MEKVDEILEKQQEDFSIIYDMIYQKYKSSIKTINEYMIKNNYTIQNCIDEIERKESKLSRSQRDLLLMIKPEILKLLFNYDK